MKNWKTTLAGVLAGVWTAIQPMVTSDAPFNWKNLIGAAVIAALGILAKDYDVTGVGAAAHN